jgi:hypothetical protein
MIKDNEGKEIIVKVIVKVIRLSNEEIISIFKEIAKFDEHKLSLKADELFKLYDKDPWNWGLDRYTEIYRCLEAEITNRIKNDTLKLI